jgi:hypothetical protein
MIRNSSINLALDTPRSTELLGKLETSMIWAETNGYARKPNQMTN